MAHALARDPVCCCLLDHGNIVSYELTTAIPIHTLTLAFQTKHRVLSDVLGDAENVHYTE